MKVPLKWLKDYVDIDIPVDELARKLTLAGLEVSDIQVIGGGWDKVIVGRILAVEPHPNADRLRLATVDLGNRQITVVCGAPNLVVKDKIAFALVGASLIDGHTGKVEELKPAKIRGVVSEGMICAEKELGISENYEGILVLPHEFEIGRPLADYLGETILDIDITPNRADCLSVMGIAREVAAITGHPFRLPDLAYEEGSKSAESYASVEIKDPKLCPRYCAGIIDGITIKSSPQWMQDRLAACGARPINNIVDVTNYVMLEFGQPLHAFDYREIRGQKIIVRRAAEGEIMYTLDEEERKLSSDILLIADAERAVAVAGIMGGLSSEVRDSTTTILLESANFSQAAIHRGSQQLKLGSEASARFEKGLNPELAMMAVRRATQLMAQLGGGKAARGIIDVYPGKQDRKPIPVSEMEVKRILGMDINEGSIKRCLESLGLHCKKGGKGTVLVDVPWWRNDINIPVDLVEEVARVTGYENIPESMLSSPLPTGESIPAVAFRRNLQDIMAGCGFQEIITYPLTSLEVLSKLSSASIVQCPEPLKMANAMSRELEYLRTSLRAGALSVLARNQRTRENNIRLFEIARIFLPRPEDLPLENEMLCGLVDTITPDTYWQHKSAPVDFYFIKGIVETVLTRLGIEAEYLPGNDATLNPAKCADVMAGSIKIGVIGEVHPAVLKQFDIAEPAFLFELDMDRLLKLSSEPLVYKVVSKYPGTTRDIAVLLDAGVDYQKIVEIVKSFSLVSELQLFDLYVGEQVPDGKKSIAFRVIYQAADRTLKDEEVDKVQKRILERLSKELGATLRS
ncbi:MAG: phenylalanine--tRNA ligase subunit beta [Dehalococcoidia bacterium]|nr:phenylalanine--tRNA ligase subunit beta [Dehalococcoidia bacterium]